MQYGWTFDDVDSMTFDQISSAWNEGKEKGIPVSSHDDVQAINRRVRRVLLGR